MDGILADFDKRAIGVLGMPPVEYETLHGSQAFWDALYAEWQFFLRMEKLPDADELMAALAHLKPTILTGKPRESDAKEQKEAWRDIHYPGVPLISVPAREKCLHMEPGDILIDDRLQHSHLWLERGGIWIDHKSTERTLHILSQLGVL